MDFKYSMISKHDNLRRLLFTVTHYTWHHLPMLQLSSKVFVALYLFQTLFLSMLFEYNGSLWCDTKLKSFDQEKKHGGIRKVLSTPSTDKCVIITKSQKKVSQLRTART